VPAQLRNLAKALVEGDLVDGKALLDLLTDLLHEFLEHQQLDIGFHGTEMLLSSRVVVVLLQGGRKIVVSDTRCYIWERGKRIEEELEKE
jgi:hypothetical protein